MKVKYSICVINKNTVGTIQLALGSVLGQISEDFQIVVVDESSDGSETILKELQKLYPHKMKVIFLDEAHRQGIGFARNVSIENADGEYCIMHIDCDDVWENHIQDFVKVYLAIEEKVGPDFLLAGHQINMARKDYLLSVGPYRTVEHGEDRDLWMRLAKRNEFIPLDHVAFFERLPLPASKNFVKALKRVIWGVRDEVRKGSRISLYFRDLFSRFGSLSWRIRVARLLVYPYARVSAKKFETFDATEYFKNVSDWNRYKEINFGLFGEVASIRGFSPSLEFLESPLSRAIFENRRKDIDYPSLKKMISEGSHTSNAVPSDKSTPE